MNRELKFRAWDNVRKVMHYPDELWVKKDNEWNCVNRVMGFGVSETDNLNGQLMQFTGLKDKNGVEIYEGDLCHIFIDRPEPIVFVDGAFGYMDASGYFISFAQNKWFFWTDYKSNEVEVLGNIYENHELLETKKDQLSERKAE